MAIGQFADLNLVSTATLGSGAWSPDLPLSNLKLDERYLTRPARQLAPAALAGCQFKVALARPAWINLIALLFHTLSPKALYRLSLAKPSTSSGTWDYRGPWLPVYGRKVSTGITPYEDTNWWGGEPIVSDLYPHHLFVPINPRYYAGAVRVEIDDRTNPAGYFDIGGLWVTQSWSPQLNFERGRTLGVEDRSLQDEAPSGRLITEPRGRRRRLTIDWTLLSDTEAFRLADAGMRAGRSKPVLFVPDIGNSVSIAQEAWPATFDPPPTPKFIRDGENTATAVFREIVA